MTLPNKHDNISEYLLYMWQLEDMLRVFELDLEKLKKQLIDPSNLPDDQKQELFQKYDNLIEMMKLEGVQKEGHLQINKNVIIELTDLHLRLLKDPKESNYIGTYYSTLPYIVELRSKSINKDTPEIEVCFVAMYGYLLLRIQKKEISQPTQTAVKQISALLKQLSEKYKTMDTEEEAEFLK